nr:IclR family transcriptional regulator [Umezawaea beigongshangensis]
MTGVQRRPPEAESVANRIFRLLDAFSQARPALTLSELSRASGLPLSTTHRMVADLTRWGALQRRDDGAYHVGLRLWELGSLTPGSLRLRENAMPFMEDLCTATQQNVQLAVLDGREALSIERLAARGAVTMATRTGSRLPLHASGVGLVLLAHADPEFQERVLASPLHRYTERTNTSPVRLRELLADTRRDGYVISVQQIELISRSIAAPVRDADGSVIAALSVVVPVEGVDVRTLVPAVRATALGISRSLGAPIAGRGG